MLLNDNTAITYAKEFTIIAMEHSMIKSDADPVQYAKNVTDFFNSIVDTLSGKEQKED